MIARRRIGYVDPCPDTKIGKVRTALMLLPDRVLFTHRCALLARGEHYLLIAAFDDD